MHAAPFSTHQGYYSQPYQFYYTATGRYCAYDANTGTHLIHSLKDNRWYPYYPDHISPTQQYSKPKSRRHKEAPEYQKYEYEYQSYGVQNGGSGYSHGGQYKSGERAREHGRKSRGEEMLYSAAAAEAAQRSLIEESNIDMDNYFEDEGVDVRMGDRSGRPRRSLKENRRHRSRSGPELRNEKAYARETGHPRDNDRRATPHTNHHTFQCRHGRVHLKQTHGHHYGSNKAGVGYEGSEHDSGYMEDFEPVPEPRRSMPGIARWLDNTPSEFSVDDRQHPFDKEHRHDSVHHSRKAREGSPHIHRTEVRVNHQSHKPHHTEMSSKDHDAWVPSKTLHRQDSGIDMSGAMDDEVDIEIDICMDGPSDVDAGDKYSGPGGFPRDSPRQGYASPVRSSDPNSSSQTHIQCCEADEEFDCYYAIPPCPSLPPLKEPVIEGGEMVLISGRQELAAPRHFMNAPIAPTFRQADSVYTPSVAATSRLNHPFYKAFNSPSMLPRAPSPPLSPPPRPHRTRRSGLGVPVVERERRYPRWD